MAPLKVKPHQLWTNAAACHCLCKRTADCGYIHHRQNANTSFVASRRTDYKHYKHIYLLPIYDSCISYNNYKQLLSDNSIILSKYLFYRITLQFSTEYLISFLVFVIVGNEYQSIEMWKKNSYYNWVHCLTMLCPSMKKYLLRTKCINFEMI